MCLSMCHFVLVFSSPFSIAITSLGEERANLSAFRTFVRFVRLDLSVSSSSWGLGRAKVNPIIVDGYASLFNCTTAVRASDSMTASS